MANKKYALISVSDKTGILDFARELVALGYIIISTGGTANMLLNNAVDVVNVSEITGFPECLDGRVKTLHPKIHGGLLAIRDNEEHMKIIKELGIDPIDIIVINLYPFRETIMKQNVSIEEAIENIDIGGPAMLRAAAKNHNDVTVITDPKDYQRVLDELKAHGKTTKATRQMLGYKTFALTAAYDAMIADYLSKQIGITLPDTITLPFEAVQDLRYGENPHQSARYYREMGDIKGTMASAEQLHGKELSYNNIADTNGAIELLSEFEETTVVAVKHANPCGVASADTLFEAWTRCFDADPKSIFGGIIATNRCIDEQTAEGISKVFIEIVIAPDFTEEALKILKKKKNIRLLKLPSLQQGIPKKGYDFKRVSGGMLIQGYDITLFDELRVVTEKQPTEKEMQDLLFAWRIVKHVKSNAIAIAKDNTSVGLGVGQVNRIWATEQAIEHGGDRVKGAVLASDAFFPFDDCVRAAAKAGITAIIQPGGSVNDQLSIDAANELGIAMVFTGQRHFKHS
ncbi:MAG TPA: bifunctional phosphoribosylaminoimidazolecarboxamide formyltransferase/IMP cyclohydrolase [Clostridiales bacterium]|nr:bifunctional phosphoribosylaminoimidazolecarboxamide formyltransferase/IMP cyclohydrolase [Clostridiales bacterium]